MTIRIAVPAMTGPLAIPLSTAENSIYAPENCRVGIENLVQISLLNASGRAGRQRKSGACCADRQRTGRGIQPHGSGLLNRHVMESFCELTK
jgi:hypothetical protein